MSYTISKTDGTVLATILDGTVNTDTGLNLIGRNYTGTSGYGALQNENFVRLLENFADTIPPGQSVGFTPISGQLWWDTANQTLNVYNGTNFYPTSGTVTASSAPSSAPTIGNTWWDTTNLQLNVWTGSAWQLVGPLIANGEAKFGTFSEQLEDTSAVFHDVLTTYLDGKIISISSLEITSFTTINPVVTAQFGSSPTTIAPGLNIPPSTNFVGSATNSLLVGGIAATQLARVDVNPTFSADVLINGNLSMSGANLSVASGVLNINNTNFGKSTTIYNNTSLNGKVAALTIDGTTGLVSVSADPTQSLGIATKQYVDADYSALNSALIANVSSLTTSISTLRSNTDANLTVAVLTQNANLQSAVSAFNSAISSLNSGLQGQIVDLSTGQSGTDNALTALENNTQNLINQLQRALNSANAAAAYANAEVTSFIDSINNGLLNGLGLTNGAITTLEAGVAGWIGANLATAGSWISANVSTVNSRIDTTNSSIISNIASAKSYTDTQLSSLSSSVGSQITAFGASITTLSTSISSKASLQSPGFTGTPTAPTPQSSGAATTQIATVGYVSTALTTLQNSIGTPPKINIQSYPPSSSSGNTGDLWFVVG
jgi:hypothetical protein